MPSFRCSGFFVKDVPASLAFYEPAFGFALGGPHPSRGDADLLGGTAMRPNRAGLDPIAAQIALVSDDLEADWWRAIAAGARVVHDLEAKPWGQTTGDLRHPDGILVELCTPSLR